jgi:hypothetical protein
LEKEEDGKEEVPEEAETEEMNPTPGATKLDDSISPICPQSFVDIELCATRTNRRRLLGNLVLAKFLQLFAGAGTVAETAAGVSGEDEEVAGDGKASSEV